MLQYPHMKSLSTRLIVKTSVVELARESLLLPFWWYSVGLMQALTWSLKQMQRSGQATGFSLWARNLFVPMYGETGFSGRLVSFVMRLVMVIVRGTASLFWIAGIIILLFFYLLILPLALSVLLTGDVWFLRT